MVKKTILLIALIFAATNWLPAEENSSLQKQNIQEIDTIEAGCICTIDINDIDNIDNINIPNNPENPESEDNILDGLISDDNTDIESELPESEEVNIGLHKALQIFWALPQETKLLLVKKHVALHKLAYLTASGISASSIAILIILLLKRQ